ncbi:MAG TPA: cytochrome b/b6 domain-containing protein [Burkholderiales bacterium]
MAGTVAVWDPLVRIVHWTVAALVVVDLFNEAGANPWHRNLGYAAGALVLLRLAWGLIGPRPARLAAMARAARDALPYARSLMRPPGEPPVGHTPLGAWMAFTLWTLVLATVFTGWLLRLDAFWGSDTVEQVHTVAAYVLGGCALVHVAGAVATSLRYRVNLVAAMVTGRKRLR